MQLVILAAGRGTRMGALTDDIPKPMLPLKNKPILEHKMSVLPDFVDEVIVVINYLGDKIKQHFGEQYSGIPIRYVFHEKLDGTGGAIHACRDVLNGDFLVVMGDDLYAKKDIVDLAKNRLAVLGYESENNGSFGGLRVDKNNCLIDIIEKAKNLDRSLVNTGAYSLTMDFFDYDLVPVSEKEFGLPQTLASMTKDHEVKVLKTKTWQPIGYPEDIKKAEEVLEEFYLG